ncbi:MAG TPA: hypothetical protein VD947_02850 [Patescibacteria group bacterium]|nr:hypothetical protein [Patescibacteria group bacterium]
MQSGLRRLFDYVPPARKAMIVPSLALSTVTSKDKSTVYASSDTLFRWAIFGRDSLEVAEDLMVFKPKLVGNILRKLASLQGLTRNDKNEEEPGKIIHEYRTMSVNGKTIDKTSQRIFHELAFKWGGDEKELAYYGSIDSTPHFLRALGRYCHQHGSGIMKDKIRQRNGNTITMQESAKSAIDWLVYKLESSESGLLEYKRINPHGILNQVWKDSEEFYVHENKEIANHEAPIASIEVQGLAYDGLVTASEFFPAKAEKYLKIAHKLRDRTLKLLWQENRKYFALGLDYDPSGTFRIINTSTANPASLLDTGFFDDLTDTMRENYVTAIVTKIMSKDFLTNAGIRSRALSFAHLINFWDYHGSYVSWPKETYDIAKGLRRQGFPKLARQLENRLLNIVLRTYEYPEFVYVDEWGRVLNGAPTSQTHGEIILIGGKNKPERVQAWTVSAILAIISRRFEKKIKRTPKKKSEPWQDTLQANILIQIPDIHRYINPLKLLMNYPTHKYKLTDDDRAAV